jgi:phospholipase A1
MKTELPQNILKTTAILSLLLCVFSVKAYADETSQQPTVLEKKLTGRLKTAENTFAIGLFKPTYILPFYYTGSPDYDVYANTSPNGQKTTHAEFKSQFSLVLPLMHDLLGWKDSSFEVAYTQLNYWQAYADSEYFRETDYEPEVFVQKPYHNWLFRGGAEHQSNGRGGLYERTWNRAYVTTQYSGVDWLVSLKLWAVIFPSEASDLHNPDIIHYLGREQIVVSKKYGDLTLSIEAQNIESGFSRGFVEPSASYQLTKHVAAYVQVFSGYGQSLIEYNHRTQSAGIGFAFNNWI